MKDLKIEKIDVVSEILDNTDLLNIFAASLKEPQEVIVQADCLGMQAGRTERARYYVWKKIKECLCFISYKIQTLAILAEYNFKILEKKVTKN